MNTPHRSSRWLLSSTLSLVAPFAILIACAIVGCGRSQNSSGNGKAKGASSGTSSLATDTVAGGGASSSLGPNAAVDNPPPASVVDRLGREVALGHVPQRIVSLSPATTELLFALGAGPAVVGATNHCNYPVAALEVPRVGSGILEGINREAILAIQPDLVVCKMGTHDPLIPLFDRADIPAISLGAESMEELFAEARLLGRAIGRSHQAEELVDRMTLRLSQLVQRVASIAPDQQQTVFYEVWDDPLMTAGPNSFIGELLNLGHMKNIFADTEARYPRISSEVVVDRNPQVILAPSTHMRQVEFERMAARPGWANIEAITKKRVFMINGDQVSRCGPRLLDALEQMIDMVYPATSGAEVPQP